MHAGGLGQKIKEARIARKLTQAEVVGSFITRNMLSQIENGTAMPSMKTLYYLSEVLGIPLSELMGGMGSDALQILQEAKECLRQGDYNGVLILCEDIPEAVHDELYALGARACLGLARTMIAADELADVTALLRRGIVYAEGGLYASDALAAECTKLMGHQATRLGNYYLRSAEQAGEGGQG